jgi:DNA-directed RNA polymerase subunit RPC12/RpoP
MAKSIWTTEEFACPGCGMNYTATKEEHSDKRSGSFKCGVCKAEVHTWSGYHNFFGWEAIKKKRSPVFGKRWDTYRGDR